MPKCWPRAFALSHLFSLFNEDNKLHKAGNKRPIFHSSCAIVMAHLPLILCNPYHVSTNFIKYFGIRIRGLKLISLSSEAVVRPSISSITYFVGEMRVSVNPILAPLSFPIVFRKSLTIDPLCIYSWL